MGSILAGPCMAFNAKASFIPSMGKSQVHTGVVLADSRATRFHTTRPSYNETYLCGNTHKSVWLAGYSEWSSDLQCISLHQSEDILVPSSFPFFHLSVHTLAHPSNCGQYYPQQTKTTSLMFWKPVLTSFSTPGDCPHTQHWSSKLQTLPKFLTATLIHFSPSSSPAAAQHFPQVE